MNATNQIDESSEQLSTKDLSLERSWAYKVAVVADLVARRVSAVVSDIGGLNLSQWRVLAAIGDRDGRTASQVVEITPMDKGIVSRAVASLIAQGLLRREASDSDGRASHLYMTPEGAGLYTRIVDTLSEADAHGETFLKDAEQDDFLRSLDHIIQSYSA